MGSGSTPIGVARRFRLTAPAMRFLPMLLAAGLTVATNAGCDQGEHTASAGAASSATPTVAAAADPQAQYRDTARPLLDELVRIKAIIDRKELDAPAFRKGMGEIEVQLSHVETALRPADKDCSSWQHMQRAITFLRKADKGIQRQDEIVASPISPLSDSDLTAEARKRRAEQFAAQAKDAAVLSVDVPRALAAASGEILVSEMDLKEGK